MRGRFARVVKLAVAFIRSARVRSVRGRVVFEWVGLGSQHTTNRRELFGALWSVWSHL